MVTTRSGKTYGKSTTLRRASRSRVVVVAPKPVTLNTRINRILSNRLETKRYFLDNYIDMISNDQQKLYLNPLAGIVVGSNSNQRVGDKITIVGIEVNVTYKGEASDAFDMRWQSTLVQARTSGTYTASSISTYAGADLNYTGFNTNGPVNDEEYKVVSNKYFNYKHPTLSATSFIPQIMIKHKIRLNKTVQYVGTSGALNPSDMLLLLNISTGGVSGITQGRTYVNYLVHYKDA